MGIVGPSRWRSILTLMPMDLGGVWWAMEEFHRLGLTRMIGVNNFTTMKLQELLAIADIPSACVCACVLMTFRQVFMLRRKESQWCEVAEVMMLVLLMFNCGC